MDTHNHNKAPDPRSGLERIITNLAICATIVSVVYILWGR